MPSWAVVSISSSWYEQQTYLMRVLQVLNQQAPHLGISILQHKGKPHPRNTQIAVPHKNKLARLKQTLCPLPYVLRCRIAKAHRPTHHVEKNILPLPLCIAI